MKNHFLMILVKSITIVLALCLPLGTVFAKSAEAKTPLKEKSRRATTVIATIDQGWTRPTIEGQTVAGGFLSFQAHETLSIIKASSPVAKNTELHEMRMDGDKMIMREVPSILVKKGELLVLKPGSLHLMFIDLKAPLQVGATVPITLTIKARGKTTQLKTELQVKAMTLESIN